MKKLIIIFAGLLLFFSSCEKPVDKGEYGNPLLRFYGDAKDDIGYSVAEANNGYVICGKLTIIERGVNEAGATIIIDENPQFGLIKTDRDGIQEWEYNAGGEGFDEGRKVIAMDDGSFVCAGTVTVTTGLVTHRDVIVTKISNSGQMVWESIFGDEQNLSGDYFDQESYDLIRNPLGGGFLIVGSDKDDTRGNDPGERNMFLLAVDDNGFYVDSYSPGFPGDEFARSVSIAPNGNFLVVGTTEHSWTGDTPGQDGLNVMTTMCSFLNLNQPNTAIYGGAEDEYVTDIVASASGNSIVGTREFGLDSKKGLFVEVEVTGIELPTSLEFSTFDLQNVVEISSIISVPEVGYMACGNTGGTEQSGDMFFMFLDQSGNNVSLPETFVTGGRGLQSVNDAIIDSEGKVVAVGINSWENNSLITLIKFDPWE